MTFLRHRFSLLRRSPALGLTLLFLVAPIATPAEVPGDAPPPAAGWKEVDRLIAEDQLAAARQRVETILSLARANGDAADWARALTRRVQIETALHGYQTAVAELRADPWPDDAAAHTILELVYGHALVTYERAYAWEIRQRERVVADQPVDLERWTSSQIRAEAERAFSRLWALRQGWGSRGLEGLAEVVEQNDYPPRIRGTLRDAVSYLWVGLLADSGAWTVAEQSTWKLDLGALIAGEPPAARVGAGEVHPLERIAATLGDLERWHAANHRPEAALEAFLERLRRLRASRQQPGDAAALTAALDARLAATPRALPWWSMASAELAEAVRAEEAPDALVRARQIALDGQRAHPNGPGGQRCRHLVAAIEAPSTSLQAMASDGLDRPSIAVEHANLEALYFRAVRLDPEALLRKAKDWSWLPRWDEAAALLRDGVPELSWRVELPATPDYRSHRTLVTPQIDRPGLWLVGSSARQDFREAGNQLSATAMVLGDLVLEVAQDNARTDWEVTVRSGARGTPVDGAEVIVVRLDWRQGHRVVRRATTGASGQVLLAATDWDSPHLLLAKRGEEVAVDPQQVGGLRLDRRAKDCGALVYTDRAVYRPGQKILWKVVAWERDIEAGTITVAGGEELRVHLRDANGEEVEAITVRTNEWGSASGELTAAPGRLLGGWSLATSRGGSAALRVEEYKRPTFEVSLAEPATELRLNRPARLAGEARYLFGLPVTDGKVSWRVLREEVVPFWWWWRVPQAGGPQVVAAGEAELDPQGRFELLFLPEADERQAEEPGLSWRFRIEAEVTDAGGETRSAERAVRLAFVAVESRIALAGDFLTAGVPAQLEALRSDLDGTPRAGEGRWLLFQLTQPPTVLLPADVPRRDLAAPAEEDAFRTPGDARRARWEGENRPAAILAGWPDGKQVASGAVAHGGDGRGVVALPALPAGAYRLRYETDDPFGATFVTSRELIVAADGQGELSLPLMLGLDRSSAAVGGQLRVLVHSGLTEQPLRLELFRGGARRWRRDLVSSGRPLLLELPVTAADRGGFTLRLSTLRDHQHISASRDVAVPWTDRELEVRFATFRDALRPGSRETWRVEVRDPNGGELASAELLASMFDRSLELIAPYSPPRPVQLFPRWFGAGTLRSSLGIAQQLWYGGTGLASLPGFPSFSRDRVKVLDGYAIGGPGVRFRGGVAMPESSRMMAPPSAMMLEKEAAVVDSVQQELVVVTAEAAAPPPGASVELRSDFAETALWQPHLRLGVDGSAAIEVDLPDSVTEWSVWVHALTADFRSGSVERRVRTVKELLVRPSLPRFFREGDELVFEVLVDNTSEQTLEPTISVVLEDPATGEDLSAAFGLPEELSRGRGVEVAAGRTVSVPVTVSVPARLGAVAVRVVARAGDLSDGELRLLPVLPGRMHLSQSRFVALRDEARRTMRFAELLADDDPSRIDEQLVVTVDAQLMTTVLRALPYLVDYPYECTEQTLNRFLSTGIVTSVFGDHPALAVVGAKLAAQRDSPWERFDAEDPNRRMELVETPWLRESRGGEASEGDLLRVLDPQVATVQRAAALTKLLAAQTSSGGFPWFPGGAPSPWMTLYLVDGFSRALEFGVEVPRQPLVHAWAYLQRYWVDELVRDSIAADCCWEMVTYLGYVLSSYPDDSWTGGVFTADDRRAMLDFGWKHWRRHAPRLKAYLALELHRAAREDDARLVLDSIMDSARTDDDLGTYWAREEKSWLWYQDTVESHAFILRAISELAPDDRRRDGLIQWLLLEKKLSHWKSTRATAEAIYALAYALERDGRLGGREVIEVRAGERVATFDFDPAEVVTRQQLVVAGPEVTPAMGIVEVAKETSGFAFASATWQFSTERLPERADGDLLSVERAYFKRSLREGQWILEPLDDGAALQPGDEVEAQLTIAARHAAEYVHLRDPRPAGFEPDARRSGWEWDLGLAWYEEVRDSGTSFFFERLPVGSYTLKHRLRARQAGRFRVSPAALQSMYAPEFTAHSAGDIVQIGAAEGK